jgi:DegV family protein with EDD domain
MSVVVVPVAYLDGVRLRRALTAGIHRAMSRQDYLNKINVFPVPDGDTGTNIAFTLNAVLGGLSHSVERHCGRLLAVVADSALDGARGNSGAILAQFFQGLSDGASGEDKLTIQRFAAAVTSGAAYARDALAEPREGTLVSVLRDFARAVEGFVTATPQADFIAVLSHGLLQAERAVADTPNHLAVLKRAGVVDAGAEGFVELLRGVEDFARNGSLDRLPGAAALAPEDAAAAADGGHDGEIAHRYCTECMVTGTDIDRRKLREELAALGSSLVLAGSKIKAKVHIHVDEPAAVFRVAGRHGAVSGQKADDMLQQAREARSGGGVAIVVDSAADIPESELERLNLHMVPVRVHFGEQGFLDKVAFTATEFYEMLERSPHHPKTSQPAPGDFRRLFQFLGSHYDEVVSVNLTSKVSGTWLAAARAAARADGAAVTVVDTLSVSAGQGLLAMYAGECARAGYDASAIARAVEAMRPRTRVWGLLRDLSYGVRGGRVARSKKLLADLLRLTPVLTATPAGFVKAGGVVFGRDAQVEKFTRFVLRRLDPSRRWRLIVGHCNAPADGAALLAALQRGIATLDGGWLVEVGPALGAHAGPGALVVGVQDYDAPRGGALD